MSEPGQVLFYHLSERPLEAAAPEILEKCLERGWSVTVRTSGPARVSALDAALWTYRDDSFLPHGTAGQGHDARQPIYLTAGPETPNDPQVLMLVDGAVADSSEMAGRERTVLMFDGHDDDAVARARSAWREAVAEGLKAVYWAQEGGRWIKRAESG